MTLTNDAKKILYKLYQEYYDMRKHGFSKSESNEFGSSEDIKNKFFPELPSADIYSFLQELRKEHFLHAIPSSGILYECELSDHAIVTMENLPKDTLISIAAFILNFKSI